MFRKWFVDKSVYVKPVFGGWAAIWHTRAESLLDDFMAYGPVVTWHNLTWMLRQATREADDGI